MIEKNSLAHLFKRFSFQIFVLMSCTIVFVTGISLYLEYKTVLSNNQKNLKIFASEIRESILRRQDLQVIEKSVRLFNDENVSSIKITSGKVVIFQNAKDASTIRSHELENVFFDSEKTKIAGEIEVVYSYGFLLIACLNITILYAAILLVLLVLVRKFLNQLNDKVIKPIHSLSDQFSISKTNMPHIGLLPLAAKEIQLMQKAYTTMADRIDDYQKKILEQTQAAAFSTVAKQVSHDIRSPLSALNMVLGQLKEVPEHQRLIIRNSVNRINDIANTLLQKSKEVGPKSEHQSQDDSVKLNIELLPALIDTLISEKRIQFRDKIGIEIEADLQNSYGAFANINATEMKRVLSNLINNAIEAFVNESGRVVVAICNQVDSVVLTVKDNGKGIPKHILAKLGEMGVTHGKEGTQSGSGLGVYHAKKTVESFGGKFEISSIEGSGTTFTMTFPAATKPKWFVEKLILNPNSPLISLDDDVSIHNIWRGRFQSVSVSKHKIEHLTFTSGDEFKGHVKALPDLEQPIYLVDYELLNQAQNGLQIIEEMKLGSRAILVTSRYEEPQIRSTCERLGVRLIPKGMAGFVPMEIARPKVKYHAILIDDDDLVHLTWNMAAKERNKIFLGFHSPDEFFAKISEFDIETPILIDSNLGNGIKGEVIAKKVHLCGFKKIYICTGYDSSEFKPQPWIIEILPKDPRFDF